jgi:lipoprotein-anchoring transpeptidase ErfK/SrfK
MSSLAIKNFFKRHKFSVASFLLVLSILIVSFGPNLIIRLLNFNKIMSGTNVSGQSVSGYNYQDFTKKLEDSYNQKRIKLKFNGQLEEASYQEAGINYDYQASFDLAYKAHRSDLWDIAFFWNNVEVEPVYSINKQNLQSYVISKFGQSDPPNNAEITFDEAQEKMIISPETNGVGVNIDKIIESISSQDISNLNDIDLVEDEVQPEISSKDLEPLALEANKYIANQVAITAGNKSISPTPKQKAEWLTLMGEDQIHYLEKPIINTQAIDDYAAKLIDGLKKEPKPEEVISGAGYNIVIAAGSDGIKVDNPERYQQQISQALAGYQPYDIDIKLNVETKPTKNYASESNRWLHVDLSEFKMIAYEGSNAVRTFAISSGATRFSTVTGNYKVYAKVRSQTMKGGDGTPENPKYEVPNVEWISYFYKDYGIHGVYWHNNFGIKNSSHGCVGITNADAEWIYNWDSIGTPVIVRQ